MFNINNIKYKNHFFYNKNYLYLCLYPIIYIIEYIAILFSAFITWYIHFTCADGHKCTLNNEILFSYIDILHILTAITIINHIYNEIHREIFLIRYSSNHLPYNTDKYVLSYMMMFFIYTINIIMSYLLLLRHNQYNIYTTINILFHSIVIIPVLFKSYNVLIDKNYTASIIFYNTIYYTKYNCIINYTTKLEHFDTNKIYTKDVYI